VIGAIERELDHALAAVLLAVVNVLLTSRVPPAPASADTAFGAYGDGFIAAPLEFLAA
jgi:hypothetical protein